MSKDPNGVKTNNNEINLREIVLLEKMVKEVQSSDFHFSASKSNRIEILTKYLDKLKKV